MTGRAGRVFSAIAILFGSSGSLCANNVHFPQVAAGGGYSTTFTLLNTGSSPLTGQLRVFNQDGSPRSPVPAAFESISIPASGSARFTLPNVGALSVGSAVFQTSGTAEGVATFELRNANGGLQTSAAVIGGAATSQVLIPVDTTLPSMNTGIAIMNPNQVSISLRLKLVNEAGTNIDISNNTVSANGQIARLVTEFFSNTPLSNFKGTLIAEAANGPAPIAAVGILVKEGIFTTLPVITSFASTDTPPNACIAVAPATNLAYPFSFTLDKRTFGGGGPYLIPLSTGTHEVTGQFGGVTATFFFEGIVAASIKTLEGPMPTIFPSVISYFNLGTGVVSFRFQFTVSTTSTLPLFLCGG